MKNSQKRGHESDIKNKQVSKYIQGSSSIITCPKAPEGDSLATPLLTQREKWLYIQLE